MTTANCFIRGEERPTRDGGTFAVFRPDTGEQIGEAARGMSADIQDAVAAARDGFDIWSNMAAGERERILLKAADIFEAEGKERLENLLIDESGSTITKAGYEIDYTPSLLRTAAGEARRLYGDTFPNDRPDRMSFVIREPIGVVGVISPYNAPLALLAKMSVFPLAAGNAVVIKPSEETPLIASEFVRILSEAGLPKGVVNLVPGLGAEAGAALVEHKNVDAIALTGATRTGVHIGSKAIQTMKRVQLELGGKNALMVLKDFDPKEAAQIAADGIFIHAGQICMANSRVIVEAGIFDEFLAAFKAKAESLSLGDLRDPNTAYGPLINEKAVDKVLDQIRKAKKAGATIVTGGNIVGELTLAPTILVDVPKDNESWRKESFGPVANVVAAKDFAEAISIANDSEYGLSAGVLTRDTKKAFAVARKIKAGSVHIGMHPFQSNALAPIGGYKMSGIGKSGGHYSTHEFTNLKWISLEIGLS